MHVWHHDVILRGEYGKNFGVLFCGWDWLFSTAYLPDDKEMPERLGFENMEEFPQALLPRMIYPLIRTA
jgi:sterol desaturase/sphingolipid hydroxylase (fatty acid hydroxylase superfamily)